MSDAVQEIKDRLNVVDVVGSYVKLTKAGKYQRGLCPFHKEKTPSFMVSNNRGFYHCFGCGRGGDVFSFIEEIEGVDFRGALAILAEKAGVELTKEAPGSRDQKEKLYAALQSAGDTYEEALKKNQEAYAYLLGRNLKEETIRSWHLGYAPDEWRYLYDALAKSGFSERVLLDAGLIKEREGEGAQRTTNAPRYYDRFRGRIMFPLSDVSGRVIGFSGRAYGSMGGDASSGAKYINSPETEVFEKSRILYGVHRAKEGIRKYGFALLVEGQFDVLLAQQAGYTNTLALSGTAFTEGHASLIRRYTGNLAIAFDGDNAGIAASGRASEIALKAGLKVKIVALPKDEDPADLIARAPSLFKKAVREALPIVDFYLAHLKTLNPEGHRYRSEVSRVVLPYVALIENAIDRAHFIQRISEALRVPEDAVETEVEKLLSLKATEDRRHYAQRNEKKPAPTSLSRLAPGPLISREDTLERLLIGVALSLRQSDKTFSVSILGTIADLVGEERIQLLESVPEGARAAIIQGDMFLEEHASVDPSSAVESLLLDLKKEKKRSAYREAVFTLKEAEREGDQSRIDELLKTVHALAKEL